MAGVLCESQCEFPKVHVPVDALYMVKTTPPPMPILWGLTTLRHSRVAIAASTAEPLLIFKMSLHKKSENILVLKSQTLGLQE